MNFVKMWQAYPHSTTTGNDKSLMGIEDDENAIQEKCGTRKHGTRMQGWKMQGWKMQGWKMREKYLAFQF